MKKREVAGRPEPRQALTENYSYQISIENMRQLVSLIGQIREIAMFIDVDAPGPRILLKRSAGALKFLTGPTQRLKAYSNHAEDILQEAELVMNLEVIRETVVEGKATVGSGVIPSKRLGKADFDKIELAMKEVERFIEATDLDPDQVAELRDLRNIGIRAHTAGGVHPAHRITVELNAWKKGYRGRAPVPEPS